METVEGKTIGFMVFDGDGLGVGFDDEFALGLAVGDAVFVLVGDAFGVGDLLCSGLGEVDRDADGLGVTFG